nr:glutamine--tRNA ligase [bacterium]
VELRCTYDPTTKSGEAGAARKVKGTIHWVSAAHAVPAEVRLYDRLFTTEDPFEGGDFLANLNPSSLDSISNAKLEPSLAEAAGGERFQFERMGYFFADPTDSRPGAPAFNRIVTLKDTWLKIQKSVRAD